MFRYSVVTALLVTLFFPVAVRAQGFGPAFNPGRDIDRLMRENREQAERMHKEMQESMREMQGRAGFPNARIPGARIPNARIPDARIPDARIPGGPATQALAEPNGPPPRSLQSREQLESGGLRLTPGEIKYASGETILVRDDDGEDVVGRLHVTVGETQMVLMPDGLLRTFPVSQTRLTTKKFVPLSISQVEEKLLSDPKLSGFKTKRSRHYLYVYNTSEIYIDSTRTILESMYPAVRKYFSRSGIDTCEPEFPLVIIAFATDDQFQEYRRMPQGVVAYYDGINNFVMLYEKSELSQHAPEIAVKSAISTIAHEGAHQILHNIGVQQRLSRWPMWLSEGIAEFYAPTSVQKGVRWSGIGSTNQLRMMEIDREWKANKPLGSGDTIQQISAADELSSRDYAYCWSLIHMLSKRHQKQLFACIRQCSELRPLDGTELGSAEAPSSTEVFTKHFGQDFPALESELHKHLSSLNYVDPLTTQTHYLVISNGQVFLTSSPEKVKEIQRANRFGRARVQTYTNRVLAEKAMKSIAN
ncbi:MAG: DUF1570 domain-containing protein [Pirellulaceae bacterium]